ncbi:MAG: hypothetical protein AMXMBFR20_35400 [Planctomycetia bacterium]
MEILGKTKAVNAVDHLRPGDDKLDLVALEVADHVPARPCGRALSPPTQNGPPLDEFVHHAGALVELLGPALADVDGAELKHLADDFNINGFGNGDELDVVGTAPGSLAGRGDTIPDLLEILGETPAK